MWTTFGLDSDRILTRVPWALNEIWDMPARNGYFV